MLKPLLLALSLATAAPAPTPTRPPSTFAAVGADRAAIEALLSDYTTAVSTKNQALFESLLLDPDIPFSGVDQAVRSAGRPNGTHNYDQFRRGVFQGGAFTQRFQNIRIEQDGALAQVSLVFVNTAADGSDWGFKTLQLLKVSGSWKIASEFYTNHD